MSENTHTPITLIENISSVVDDVLEKPGIKREKGLCKVLVHLPSPTMIAVAAKFFSSLYEGSVAGVDARSNDRTLALHFEGDRVPKRQFAQDVKQALEPLSAWTANPDGSYSSSAFTVKDNIIHDLLEVLDALRLRSNPVVEMEIRQEKNQITISAERQTLVEGFLTNCLGAKLPRGRATNP